MWNKYFNWLKSHSLPKSQFFYCGDIGYLSSCHINLCIVFGARVILRLPFSGSCQQSTNFQPGLWNKSRPLIYSLRHILHTYSILCSFLQQTVWCDLFWASNTYSMWREQKVWQKQLRPSCRAIHLKPKNLSYLNFWLIVLLVCVCFCVCVSACLCDNSKHYRYTIMLLMLMSICYCHSVNINMFLSLFEFMSIYWFHSVFITLFISLCWCHSFNVTLLRNIYVIEKHLHCKRWLMILKIWQKQLSPCCQRHPPEASNMSYHKCW